MSLGNGIKSLIEDAMKAVNCAPEGFTRGIVILETKDGNFLCISRGDNLEPAIDAAIEAVSEGSD